MKIIVTGGAGFIGSALVRHIIEETAHGVINVDCLTYAGNETSVAGAAKSDRYVFEKVDIRDAGEVDRIFRDHSPDAIMHLAAESHVDRSIDNAADFITTNIEGTFVLLEASQRYVANGTKPGFRFLHVSTDEVFGSLGADGLFSEETPYDPKSPYAASKAAADHLARAWHNTYALPVIITNCSNNFGPYQFPEKLIPLCVLKAISGEKLPIYGTGENVRDWLYVDDHCKALLSALENGEIGETYTIGGNSERTNLEVVEVLCTILDEQHPRSDGLSYSKQIEFVDDRPGHDQRYAIDSTKITTDLGWRPGSSFEEGMKKTVQWYFDNQDWCKRVSETKYAGERLGTGK